MKLSDGIWFPDSEIHLVKMVHSSQRVDGKGTYQYTKLITAMEYVRKRRCAVDVGMHIGLWSMHLAKLFKYVIGFEPVSEHIECLRENMKEAKNYEVNHYALGAHRASVGLKFLEGSTGSTHIDVAGSGIAMRCLDDLQFDHIDFLKVDVEGYEYFVIAGGKETILKHKPVIIVEQKGGKHEYYGRGRYDAKQLIESWGAKTKFDMHGDICLAWG